MDVPAVTINKVCLSGLHAIALADQLIRCGEFGTVVAGGMESMTRAPHLLPPGTRSGLPYGDFTVHDHLAYDGLHDIFTDLADGRARPSRPMTSRPSAASTRTRYAAQSHQRAAAAAASGLFKQEIEPVVVRGRRADTVIDADEGIRAETTVRGTGASSVPRSGPDGTITAGSASQISDGAAAVVVMSRDEADAQGLDWLAEITAHGMVAGPDSTLQDKPARAIRAACRKAGIDPAELDLVEINEAFSAVAHLVDAGPRRRREHRERERRRHRARPPDRHVRRADRAAPGSGAAPARRRRRRRPRSAAAAARAMRCWSPCRRRAEGRTNDHRRNDRAVSAGRRTPATERFPRRSTR